MKDIRSISPSTQFCAVIGNPVAHSLSPAIHNAAFAEPGLDFVYVACRVEDVKNAVLRHFMWILVLPLSGRPEGKS